MTGLVSVRMPASLVRELKALVAENHYLDLSEEIRSVVRQKAKEQLDPLGAEVGKLRERLETEIKQHDEQLRKEEILRELKRLLEVGK